MNLFAAHTPLHYYHSLICATTDNKAPSTWHSPKRFHIQWSRWSSPSLWDLSIILHHKSNLPKLRSGVTNCMRANWLVSSIPKLVATDHLFFLEWNHFGTFGDLFSEFQFIDRITNYTVSILPNSIQNYYLKADVRIICYLPHQLTISSESILWMKRGI